VLKLQHVWTMGEVQQMVTMDQHKNLVTTMMMKKEQKNSRETKSTNKTPKHEFCNKWEGQGLIDVNDNQFNNK